MQVLAIIAAIIGFVGGFILLKKDGMSTGLAFESGLNLGLLGAVSVITIYYLLLGIIMNVPFENYIEDNQIYPIDSELNYVRVNQYAGSHNVSLYTYVVKNEDEKKLESITSNSAYIRFTNDEPILRIVKRKYKYQGLITFLLHNSLENIDHYELYVPKESISFARE